MAMRNHHRTGNGCLMLSKRIFAAGLYRLAAMEQHRAAESGTRLASSNPRHRSACLMEMKQSSRFGPLQRIPRASRLRSIDQILSRPTRPYLKHCANRARNGKKTRDLERTNKNEQASTK